MKFTIASIIILFILTGCASFKPSEDVITAYKPEVSLSQDDLWHLMIGSWYGKQPTKDGGIRQQITKRMPNGTYVITFRYYDSEGNFNETNEVGFWGVSGPIYFSIYRGWIENNKIFPTDPGDPYNYNSYEITEINNEIFKYKSYSSGNIFTLKRVGDEFEFPKL